MEIEGKGIPMNATYLFLSPDMHFRNSESFWSSLFAIQVLEASFRRVSLHIPVFVYQETAKRWWFDPVEPLVVPAGLDFASFIVEGKLRTGFIPSVSTPLPKDFIDLRPDIVFKGVNTVSVIETKTVGAGISEKESLYVELCNWLIAQGCAAEAYLLLSAGHQPDNEVRMLATKEWKGPRKLILWEKFFETVESNLTNSLITRLIPNLHRYYKPDEDYLAGNK